jgi:hypothetical protein
MGNDENMAKEDCPLYSASECLAEMITCDYKENDYKLCLRYRVHNLKPGIMQLR